MIRGESIDPAIKGTRKDPFYDEARSLIQIMGRASIASVQRHLRIGYNHAAALIDAMEGDILGPLNSAGQRPLLKTGESK